MPLRDRDPTTAWWPGRRAARAVVGAARAMVGRRLTACRVRLLALGATLLTAVVVPVVWWGYTRVGLGAQAAGSVGTEASTRAGDRTPVVNSGLPVALTAPLLPIVPLHASLNPAHWAGHILQAIAGALTTFIGSLFTDVIIAFLLLPIPPSPSTAPNAGMNAAYSQNLQYALMLLPVVVLLGLAITPVSRRDRASLRRQLWRLILVFIALGAGQPFLRLAGQTVNVSTQLIAPQQYVFSFGGQLMSNGLEAILGSGLVIALGLILIDLGIIVIGVLVLGFLYLRQFLFQMVYIGFPLLVLAWYLDWGPLRYSKQVANLVFSITGLLAVLGPVIALGLQTGCVVAGAQSASGCFTGSATVSQSASAPDLWRRFLGWATGLALAMIMPMRIGRMVGMPMAMGGSGGGGGGGGSAASASGGGGSGGGAGAEGGGGAGGGPAAAMAAGGGGGAAAATASGPEARPPQAVEEAWGGARHRAANLGGDISTLGDIGGDALKSSARWGGRAATGAGSAAATAAGYASESAEASMRETGQQVSAGVDATADAVGDTAERAGGGLKELGSSVLEAAGTVADKSPEPVSTAVKTGVGAAYVPVREAVAAGKFIHHNPNAGVLTMSQASWGRVRSLQWSTPRAGGEGGASVSPSGTDEDPYQATFEDLGYDMPDPSPEATRYESDDTSWTSGAEYDFSEPGPNTDDFDEPPPGQPQLNDEQLWNRSIQSTLSAYTGDTAGGGASAGGGGADADVAGESRATSGRPSSSGERNDGDGPEYTDEQVDAASADLSDFWEE